MNDFATNEKIVNALRAHHEQHDIPCPHLEIVPSLPVGIERSYIRSQLPAAMEWRWVHYSAPYAREGTEVPRGAPSDYDQLRQWDKPALTWPENFRRLIDSPEYWLVEAIEVAVIGVEMHGLRAQHFSRAYEFYYTSEHLRHAWELGLGWMCYSLHGNEFALLLVLMPEVQLDDGVLHCEDGPAIRWPDNTGHFVINGKTVPPRLAQTM